jgi:GNAT superfamily N-acetyltransferase
MTQTTSVHVEATAVSPHGPDRVLTAQRGAAVVGSASLWHRSTPSHRGGSTALLGSIEALDATALSAMIEAAAGVAAAIGARTLLGPIDGSTWRSYRTVVASNGSPPFRMEPNTPAWWPDAFARAGCTPDLEYRSEVDTVPPTRREVEAIAELEAGHLRDGIVVRTIDRVAKDAALEALHTLSMIGFAENPLFTPLDRSSFDAAYAPLLDRVPPPLALVAFEGESTDAAHAVGFMFGFLEPNWPSHGGPPAVVLKTIAVRPEFRGLRLGRLLLERCRLAGWTLGARSTIYALMHEANRSTQMTTPTATILRRYAVHGRRCAP